MPSSTSKSTFGFDDPVLQSISRRRQQDQDHKEENKADEVDVIINPLTKRTMKVGGRAHKAYLKSQGADITTRTTFSKPQGRPAPRQTQKPAASRKRKTMSDPLFEFEDADADEQLTNLFAGPEVSDEDFEKLVSYAKTFLPAKTVEFLFN